MKSLKELGNSSVLIASHEVFEDGAPQALEKFLSSRTRALSILLFPFKDAPEQRVGFRRWAKGREVVSKRWGWTARSPHEMVGWLRDVLILMAHLARHGRKIDLFVGVDPLNCAVGLLMRQARLVKGDVIYYTIDYVPKRFGNERINRFYHGIDEFCCRRSDVIWNVSAEIASARMERSGTHYRANQVVVPIGVHQVAETPQAEPLARLVYLGILLEKQGLQYVIPALPGLAKKIPGLVLDIIGTGPYEPELRKQVEAAGATELVNFGGYVKENSEIQRQLTKGGVSLATYDPDPNSFTRFADPSKLKAYLAAGLPIILTDVPAIAPTLVHEGCAVIVEPNPKSIAQAVEKLLGDPETFRKQASAALNVARGLLWDQVFNDAFTESAPR